MTPASYWKQVREALNNATPGPWYADTSVTGDGSVVMSQVTGFRVAHLPVTKNVDNDINDAVFIALSIEAVGLALARIEELEAALTKVTSRLGCYAGLRDDCKVVNNGLQCFGCETLDAIDAALGKP